MNRYKIKNRFLILFGSETGKSKAIAEDIGDKAAGYGLLADLCCLSWTDKKFDIKQESCVVFVISTSGEGDPPSTAKKFFRRISKITLSSNYLESLNYTILAIGDSSYPTFCACGKNLGVQLEKLSAKQFYPSGFGDEAVGIETGVEPWINDLWPALINHLGLNTKFMQASNSNFINQVTKVQKGSNSGFKPIMEVLSNKSAEHNNLNKETVSSSEKLRESRNMLIYSVLCSAHEMQSKDLRIPNLPEQFLSVTFDTGKSYDKEHELKSLKNRDLPSSAAPIIDSQLVCAKRLTCGTDVKESLELTFSLNEEYGEYVRYQPGDSFGFLCSNPEEEITALLERLDILHSADIPCSVSVKEEHSNKLKSVAHLPELCTLRCLFTSFCDIRSVPKKVLLRILSEYTSDDDERLSLKYLCSQQGSLLYTECVRQLSLSLFDILCALKSCKPPVERILEYLPALKPRFYSVASSPLSDRHLFRIVFNVVEIYGGEGQCKARKGICTGWLSKMSQKLLTCSSDDLGLSSLSLDSKLEDKVLIYKRRNRYFLLPGVYWVPIIMVGPGTGVAPFVGFLQHRELQMKKDNEATFGETWLFYGCRYKDKDFLYKEELNRLVASKALTHLKVSFSRDEFDSSMEFSTRYVHDNIKYHAKGISRVIDSGGIIYVCGDAKHMALNVFEAFVEAMQISKSISVEEAKAFMKNVVSEKRYLSDVWA